MLAHIQRTAQFYTPPFLLRWLRPCLVLLLLASLASCEEVSEISGEEQQRRDDIIIRDYLADFNQTADRTPSGLFIQRLRQGSGTRPNPGDTAVVHYKGWLLYGDVFDSSIYQGSPFEMVIGARSVIPAWEEAVPLMTRGDMFRIYVPSHLGYGRQGRAPNIPGNAILVFDIDLLEIRQRR